MRPGHPPGPAPARARDASPGPAAPFSRSVLRQTLTLHVRATQAPDRPRHSHDLYFARRLPNTGTGTQVTTYSRYPKVVLVTDCRTHLVLAAAPGRGPASDLVLFRAALRQAVGRARIGTLLADADFDGEWVHDHARSYGIRTLIPPERGRPSEKPPAGRWRRRMKRRFDRKKEGQRWQTETVNSMIKRRLGSALRARTYGSQCREIILRVITHNVMVVMRVRVFYRALLTPYPGFLTPYPGLV